MNIVTDKKVIMGIGIGVIITSILVIAAPSPAPSKDVVEKMAKDMGMIYKDEIKAMYNTK